MVKLKEVFKNKILRVFLVAILVVIIIILVSLFIFKNREASLDEKLEDLGRTWYETYYWENIASTNEKRADALMKYQNIGVTIDLSNLSKYPFSEGKIEEFINDKTKEACDLNNTKVRIIPESPFGKENYKIEVTLDCGLK